MISQNVGTNLTQEFFLQTQTFKTFCVTKLSRKAQLWFHFAFFCCGWFANVRTFFQTLSSESRESWRQRVLSYLEGDSIPVLAVNVHAHQQFSSRRLKTQNTILTASSNAGSNTSQKVFWIPPTPLSLSVCFSLYCFIGLFVCQSPSVRLSVCMDGRLEVSNNFLSNLQKSRFQGLSSDHSVLTCLNSFAFCIFSRASCIFLSRSKSSSFTCVKHRSYCFRAPGTPNKLTFEHFFPALVPLQFRQCGQSPYMCARFEKSSPRTATCCCRAGRARRRSPAAWRRIPWSCCAPHRLPAKYTEQPLARPCKSAASCSLCRCMQPDGKRRLKAFSHQRLVAWFSTLCLLCYPSQEMVITEPKGQCRKINGMVSLHCAISAVQKQCAPAKAARTAQQINAGGLKGLHAQFTQETEADLHANLCAKPLVLCAICVNIPIDSNVFHYMLDVCCEVLCVLCELGLTLRLGDQEAMYSKFRPSVFQPQQDLLFLATSLVSSGATGWELPSPWSPNIPWSVPLSLPCIPLWAPVSGKLHTTPKWFRIHLQL